MTNLKEVIKERYGKIVEDSTADAGCCGITSSSCCGPSPSSCMADEYDPEIVNEFASANLGLGCGAPTKEAGIKEGMTVLDLGSGAGIDVFISSKYVGDTGKVIGLDMTEAMVKRARENAHTLGITNVEFHLGEIENMPIPSNSIDRIISNCVLNLVPDKSKAFAEIYRVLKPGGAFIVSDVVSTGTIPEEIRNNPDLWAGCIAGATDVKEYLNIIATAGFTNVEILKQKPYPQLSSKEYMLLSVTIKGVK
jgi:arsenite methyltransferase